MTIGAQSTCRHVYLHVDRRFHSHGRGDGFEPVWKCSLKKKQLDEVCGKLTSAGLISSCHTEECPLATAQYTSWDKCPLYTPKRKK